MVKNYRGLLLGLAAFVLSYSFLNLGEGKSTAEMTAAISILMAVWWITEALPLGVTALMPIILYPVLNVFSTAAISSAYINSTIFLFVGGFLIAIAIEKWDLHKRISINIIYLLGGSVNKIILGFMAASAFLSMWISNTATTLMMLPIGLSLIKSMKPHFEENDFDKISKAIFLGIAYSCSIGGIATLIGTPPNLVLQQVYKMSFPDNEEIIFGNWVLKALPITLVMFVVAYFLLTKVFFKIKKNSIDLIEAVKEEKFKLGKISNEEKKVLIVFIATALLWIFRQDLNFGVIQIPGWSGLLPSSRFLNDTSVAITMAVLLFIIPSRNGSTKLLDVKSFSKVPWDIILLYGGGFALAKAFIDSGLSEIIGSAFSKYGDVHPLIFIWIICISITFLTEFTSNTATTQIILPILAAVALSLDVEPLLLMIPATISASMAFMMPVATPPNAIVFGSGYLRVSDMARVGIVLNIIGSLVISLLLYYLL